MRKCFLLLMGLILSWSAAMAADIDLTTAQSVARSFMSKQVANGRLRAAAASNLKLAKAEASVVNPKAVDYYIFNAEKSYVVVAGDDLAPAILMYGEEGTIDLNDIPPAMQWLLNKYKYQIDGLKAGTHRPNFYSPKAVTAVPPMVTANWDQSAPYYNHTPTSGSSHAVTGCPATSLSMCYYRWKWPKTFPACARIPASSDYYGTYLEAPAIESRAADWDNIIDEYTGPSNYNSTSAQKDAVAWLMRYAGQTIPEYQYSTSASGATDPNILQGLKNMGYTDARLLTLTNGYAGSNQYYTDAQWNEWMLAELHAGRPIEYLASDRSAGGHAFNVFGCDTNGKYYVNWGWSGDSNGYCTLHNFTTATGSTGQSGSFVFNYGEAMIIGIEPPAGALGPQLNVNSTSVGFTTAGQQKIITLTGSNLTSDVTVALNDPSDAFSLSVAGLNNANINAIQPKSTGSVTIPKASISESTPVNIVVTLKAGVQSNASGTVTLSSAGAENVTVALNASLQEEETGGTASDAYLNIAKYATIDEAGWRNGYFNKLYAYTEDTDNEVAWLTLPIYGAWASWNYQKSNGAANGQGPQRWITSASISGNVNGTATWSESSPFLGSSVYFTSNNPAAKYFGNTSNSASSLRTITFNVKNVTEVKVLGKNNSNNNLTGTGSNGRDKYRSQMVIYECQENNGTITPSSTAVTTQRGATGATANVTLAYSDLDAEKIYQVVVTTYRTQLYEIAFCTPLAVPKLEATPTTLSMRANAGESKTATFNVKGQYLPSDVSVALSGDNAFSVSTTSISSALAEVGTDVTVTFSPQAEGSYSGTVTLTSGSLSTTVTLNGSCGGGDAHGDYLDIAKYATIDENDWYSAEYGDKPYEYTTYPDQECAWLTMPAYMAYGAWVEDNQGWGGMNSDMSIWNGITWTASDVFKGSSDYFGSQTAYFMGSSAANTSGTNTLAIQAFNVTNCTQAKAYCYNYTGTTSSYPAIMMISELTEGADGTLTESEDEVDYKTASTTGWVTLSSVELDPDKIYRVYVAGYHTFICEMGFRTPLGGLPGVPTIVSATPTATTSDIVWTAGDNNDDWNLRYRPYVETTTETTLWDFENSSLGNWTTIDADGDGYNWILGSAVGGVYLQAGASLSGSGHSATDLVVSGSYSNVTGVGALTPDNYLVSPKVKLGGSISFWAKGQDASYPAEVFGVAVSTNSNTNVADFRMVGADKTATSDWVQYTFDLSAYAGQEGYVAIRHYNVSDMFMLDIDDIEITYFGGAEPSPWIYVNSVESPYTIEGLTPETTYEVQVQGVNDISTSAWTASTLFTTLAIEGQDLAYIEEHGVPGTTYRVSNELVAVDYAIVGDVVYLWCKDQGNASIAPAPAVGDKIDYLRYDQYAQAGRAWDESNWVVLKFTPGSVAEKVKSITDAVGHELNAGTITGVYSDAVNYTITMPAGEGMPAGAVGDESSYTPNVYCVANFNPANLTADGAQSNENGNVYFFMTPKVQEVCEITYAYWNAENFIVPTTSGFVGSLSLDWTYNEAGNVTSQLNADNVYRFKTVVQRTGATTSLPALKAEGGNYKVAPLNLTSASKADIPTAIGTVKAGVDVVDVYYVNSIGVMSKTPFHGVNVVVTRYSDGSRSSVKKVFK